MKADPNPFRYCGEYFDEETDEIYLRNRSYASRCVRFTSNDPAQDGLNLYTYCGNDPVRLVDPLGLAPIGSGDKDLKDSSTSKSSSAILSNKR